MNQPQKISVLNRPLCQEIIDRGITSIFEAQQALSALIADVLHGRIAPREANAMANVIRSMGVMHAIRSRYGTKSKTADVKLIEGKCD